MEGGGPAVQEMAPAAAAGRGKRQRGSGGGRWTLHPVQTSPPCDLPWTHPHLSALATGFGAGKPCWSDGSVGLLRSLGVFRAGCSFRKPNRAAQTQTSGAMGSWPLHPRQHRRSCSPASLEPQPDKCINCLCTSAWFCSEHTSEYLGSLQHMTGWLQGPAGRRSVVPARLPLPPPAIPNCRL